MSIIDEARAMRASYIALAQSAPCSVAFEIRKNCI